MQEPMLHFHRIGSYGASALGEARRALTCYIWGRVSCVSSRLRPCVGRGFFSLHQSATCPQA